ncbi:hypothetical protein PLICRDRAFT_33851 [Plicaturopsis crispa FD-325 SS-3]|nr:hypothetical protein PLICRDRAFT_33851 [Plicaturopsis crispa FD-325 SS-3]
MREMLAEDVEYKKVRVLTCFLHPSHPHSLPSIKPACRAGRCRTSQFGMNIFPPRLVAAHRVFPCSRSSPSLPTAKASHRGFISLSVVLPSSPSFFCTRAYSPSNPYDVW